jgi:succinoglycan biosynthesis transport protein ExoP
MDAAQDKLVRLGNEANLPGPRPFMTPEAVSHTLEPENDSQISLVDYWATLVKRRWIVITALISILALTAVHTWKQTPIYRATLKLQIDTEQPNILPFKDYTLPDFTYIPTDEYLKTQFEALSSRTLATRVIRALKLETDPRFAGPSEPGLTEKAMQWARTVYHVWRPVHTPPVQRPTNTQTEQRVSPLAAAFVSGVTVTPIKDSRVVVVSFDSANPNLAADALNKLASEYIQMNFETKYEATITASEFLAKQLIDLKNQVEKSEAELVNFGQQHNIYALGEKDNFIMQKLSDLNAALTLAQSERIQKESIWKVAQQLGAAQFPDLLRNDDIRQLEANLG